MSAKQIPSLAVYNPDLLSREELTELFVARGPLLARLLDELRTSPQHHLIIGQRGMGKTMLLRRLAVAIEDDKKLAKRWLPLVFPEEQYNIARTSDFWVNCLDAIGDALERGRQVKDSEALDADVERLATMSEKERSVEALATLRRWMKRLRRGLVLLLDNVDLIFDRLKADQWALREVLSEENSFVFIGASSGALAATYDYGAAFYDFFKLDELRGLDESEAHALLLHLAEVRQTPHVAEILQKDPGRFRALHVLTGGNPRTLVLLYGVLALEGHQDVHEDLEKLLDQCTPLYKARVEELAGQTQQVFDGLALHWDPITAGDLSARLRLDVNAVSSQLSRLVQQGIVEKVPLPPGSRIGFQVAERFFNIWYLMRASRRLRRRLVWLVEFLKLFYGQKELYRRATSIVSRPPPDRRTARAAELALAYGEAIDDRGLKRALESHAIELLFERGKQTRRMVDALLDLHGADLELAPVVDRMAALREVQRVASKSRVTIDGRKGAEIGELLTGSAALSMPQKRYVARVAATPNPGSEFEEIVRSMVESESAVRTSNGLTGLHAAVRRGLMPSIPDIHTSADIDAIAGASAALGNELLLHVVLSLVFSSRPTGEHPALADAALRLTDGQRCLWSAAALLVEGHLASSLGLARHILRTQPAIDVAFIIFAAWCAAKGHAGESVTLVEEYGVNERWRPLHEALLAVAEGSRDRLIRTAPEVRIAAERLYELVLQMRDPPTGQGKPTPVPGPGDYARRAARGRRPETGADARRSGPRKRPV